MEVARACSVCGQSYKANPNRLKWGRQTTCSRQCSYELRGRQKKTGHVRVCPVCQHQFYRPPSQVKSKHETSYCSRRCHYIGRSLGLTKRVVAKPYRLTEAGRRNTKAAQKRGVQTRKKNQSYRHSEETLAKLREAAAKNIASGRIKRVSKIEDIVAKELSSLGVPFRRQELLRGTLGRYVACLDFFLPTRNTAIEVNGTFWHADPRFYDPRDLFPAQRRTIERYARKAAILRERGIKLIEIWESDLRHSSHDAVKNALATQLR